MHVSGYEPSSGWNLPPGCFESDPRAPWNQPDPWEGRTCRECRFCGRVQGAGGEAVCAFDAMTGGGPDVEAVDETSEACECFEFE